MSHKLLRIDRITVAEGRMTLLVSTPPGAPRRTDARMAACAARLRPTLAAHACINDRGPAFGAVMADTPVAHLLEHLVIDFQVHDGRALTEQRFVGATQWHDEAAGVAEVEVNFYDDLVVLQALRDAVGILDRIADDTLQTG